MEQQTSHDDDDELLLEPTTYGRRSFFVEFFTTKGPPQVAFVILVMAFGLGSTVGIVPEIVQDRYARLDHGYTSPQKCSSYAVEPQACLDGSSEAQDAATGSNLVSNALTFCMSALMGSISDERGRKGLLVLAAALAVLAPVCLVLMQLYPTMRPSWYYAANAASGIVSFTAVALSALADVMPPKWRAASFGLAMAGTMLGFALSPSLAFFLNRFQLSVLSLGLTVLGLILVVVLFPETLPPEEAALARQARAEQLRNITSKTGKVFWMVSRPLREIAILNRSNFFRLLALLAFASGMVTSTDQTLLIYYVEAQLGFNAHDVATMFVLVGSSGLVMQGILLKPLNDCMGERLVLFVSFFVGAINNFLFGIATNKATIYVAVVLAAFTTISFPTIAAIKSNNVEGCEQGRVQGALYSVQSLASGLGPVALRYVEYISEKTVVGPGAMFLFATVLLLMASFFSCWLPKAANSSPLVNVETDQYSPIPECDSSSSLGQGGGKRPASPGMDGGVV